jgi:hypothetical protein
MSLVRRESTHDAAMLLPANLERARSLLVVENPFAHFLLHLIIRKGVLHVGRSIDVSIPPVRDQFRLAVEIFAAEVAATGLGMVWQARPFVPRSLDERSWDVWLELGLAPAPRTRECVFPFCDFYMRHAQDPRRKA